PRSRRAVACIGALDATRERFEGVVDARETAACLADRGLRCGHRTIRPPLDRGLNGDDRFAVWIDREDFLCEQSRDEASLDSTRRARLGADRFNGELPFFDRELDRRLRL